MSKVTQTDIAKQEEVAQVQQGEANGSPEAASTDIAKLEDLPLPPEVEELKKQTGLSKVEVLWLFISREGDEKGITRLAKHAKIDRGRLVQLFAVEGAREADTDGTWLERHQFDIVAIAGLLILVLLVGRVVLKGLGILP